MTRPTFLHGAGIAVALALSGAALFAAISPFTTPAGLLRLIVAGLALTYVVYLLAMSRVRTGRIATFVMWLVAATGAVYLTPSLPSYLMAHALLIWLVRSLFFHGGVLPALIDAGLSLVALAASVWAAMSTGSLFLALWCFFLVQALFVAIPTGSARPCSSTSSSTADAAFERAYRNAEAAVRRLSTNT